MSVPVTGPTPPFRIGIDVGGTFTDMVLIDAAGARYVFKAPSVPEDPGQGVIDVLELAGRRLGLATREILASTHHFIHGSTIATNTMLEGKGAKVGLLATRGFRDTLEIRRGSRADIWDHRAPFAPVLVPRHLRLPVGGRMSWEGRELEPLSESDIVEAAKTFAREEVGAIAVCLLHAYANPAHEQAARDILRRELAGHPSVQWISLSSEVVPLIGEYERGSTTVVNAYLAPRVSRYLLRLAERLEQLELARTLYLQQSNGGAMSVGQAALRPVNVVLSGPAAGVGALRYYAGTGGSDRLVSMEIGGTSTDVIVMSGGEVGLADQLDIAGYCVAVPAVDIHTVGAGGGTIAAAQGALMGVGPRGAGAVPGPAAYGRGGIEPTVTDAQLVLGRLHPGPYAGGTVTLGLERARAAIEARLARPLGLSLEDAAIGVVRLANQHMRQAVEKISIERGIDVRNFTLVPCGGAGPMHGVEVARALGMARVLVPRQSGAFCALGMLNADVRQDFERSVLERLEEGVLARLEPEIAALEREAGVLLAHESFAGPRASLARALDLRYAGQLWHVRVPWAAGDTVEAIRVRFEAEYDRLYGHIQPGGTIEIGTLRVIATGHLPAIEPIALTESDAAPPAGARRRVWFERHGWREDAAVHVGSGLLPGMRLEGPLIIEEATTTLVAGPGDKVRVDRFGDFVVEVRLETA
jgi:N-methylhydantoinase A